MMDPLKVSPQGFFRAEFTLSTAEVRLRMTTETGPSLAMTVRDFASQLLPTQIYAMLVIRGIWKLGAQNRRAYA